MKDYPSYGLPDDRCIVIPTGPACKRCGHSPCCICQTWCDNTDCPQCGLDSDYSECELDELDLELWLSIVTPYIEYAKNKGLAIREEPFYWRDP